MQRLTLKTFLEVVEIQTKIASFFPFIIGVLFTSTYFHQFHFGYTLFFFIGMLLFDMTTTAINNYMDYTKATSATYKYEQNVIGREKLDPVAIRHLIFLMMGLSAIVGFSLSILTGWFVFVFGGLMCLIGIFYTFGPLPLSRMPLGELFSGVTMGLGIFALVVYLNTVNDPVFYLAFQFSTGVFSLNGNIWQILAMVWAALPLMFTIADIMLANNLRDFETDIENERYTLVYHIGKKSALRLFQLLMYSCYLVILIGWPFGVFSWEQLLVFLTLPLIHKHLMQHKKQVEQPKSFGYAIKNMILFNSAYALSFVLTLIFS